MNAVDCTDLLGLPWRSGALLAYEGALDCRGVCAEVLFRLGHTDAARALREMKLEEIGARAVGLGVQHFTKVGDIYSFAGEKTSLWILVGPQQPLTSIEGHGVRIVPWRTLPKNGAVYRIERKSEGF